MAVSVAFRCYDFESFRGYLKNMQALTKKHREIVTQDEADFSSENIRKAVQEMDSIHPDLTNLINNL